MDEIKLENMLNCFYSKMEQLVTRYTAYCNQAIPEPYTLPIATADTLGGVRPIAKTEGMTQEVGVDEAGALFTMPGSGGGAFKTFDLKLSDDTNMRIVDMGSDMICVSFAFSGKKTVNDFMYTIPTDNAEFNTWFSGKMFVFGPHPIVQGYDTTTEGGLQGMYSNFDFIAMMGAPDTEFGGMFMFAPGNDSTGSTIKGNIDALWFTVVTRELDATIFA